MRWWRLTQNHRLIHVTRFRSGSVHAKLNYVDWSGAIGLGGVATGPLRESGLAVQFTWASSVDL